MQKMLQILPAVDAVLTDVQAVALCEQFDRNLVKQKIQIHIDALRTQILHGNPPSISTKQQCMEWIIQRVSKVLDKEFSPSLRHIINATGIVLHTGLGRAPLSAAAQAQITNVMQGYCNIELDLQNGKRGNRTDHVRQLLTQLTGAEDVLVVNNNAAAVFLALNTLAFGKEAIISRGQLVEIGGSFRIPDVMQKSGVIMREIGTTNKTKLSDYEQAINERTGAIVVAHTSNYRVLGFTHEPELADICKLAHSHNLPILHDLGGGILTDLQQLGLPYEPLVQDSMHAGTDVITFSGDKILGGPQSGIIVGRKQYLDAIFANPIMRALRVDKLIYAALEATLKLFFSSDLLQQHQTLKMLIEKPAEIAARAEKILARLSIPIKEKIQFEIVTCFGQVGSGALPLEKLQSRGIAISAPHKNADTIALQLRQAKTAVVGYIQEDKVILDVRTILETDIELLIEVLESL